MNVVFFLLIASAYAASVWQQWQWSLTASTASPMHTLTEQMLHATNDAVTLAIGLIGILALFLGLMRIIEEAGLLNILAKLIYPLLKPLFPEIPANHPAFGAMLMNISANLIGIGNAATPFGLKAMQELDKLNSHPGIASNAMVLFLAINTAGITLIPTKVIALRAAAGSSDAAGIIATTLVASLCATIVAIIAAKLLQRLFPLPQTPVTPLQDSEHTAIEHYPMWVSITTALVLLMLIPLTLFWGKRFSPWIIPTLVVIILLFGLIKKVDIYASFTEGAKGGFEMAIKIIPFLVAVLMAIAMFRASGVMTNLMQALTPFTTPLGLPAEALPMVLMRPLSGSGSYGVLSDVLNNPAIGPDSYTGYLVSTLMGSTETTFYVIAVYFGAVQIRRIRHAIAAGLLADITEVIAAVVAVKFFIF